jgi:phage gp45-like
MSTFTYEALKYRLKNPTVDGNLELLDDGAVLKIGNDDDLQLTHSGSAGTITNNPGDLTLDVAGDIVLDAGGSDIRLSASGTQFGILNGTSSNFNISSTVSDKDIIFQGNDDGTTITALTLDMSDAGTAVFNHDIRIANDGQIGSASDADAITIASSGAVTFSQAVTFSSAITLSGGISGNVSVSNLDLDGATDIGAALVDADLMLVDDGADGTNRKATMSRMKTYILESVYPVGSIFTSTSSTNPGTSLGFGTWEAFGEGRVLVGKASSGTFATGGATGGAETHTLTISEMPAHDHPRGTSGFSDDFGGGGTQGYLGGDQSRDTGVGADLRATTQGGGSAHNILQPYIVVYMWKRTS